VHSSADVVNAAFQTVRAAFEYQVRVIAQCWGSPFFRVRSAQPVRAHTCRTTSGPLSVISSLGLRPKYLLGSQMVRLLSLDGI
jgi:hypothetical protein